MSQPLANNDDQAGRLPEIPLNPALAAQPVYPFPRLRSLIGDQKPGKSEINVSFGEPKHDIAPLAIDVLAENTVDWNRYPPPRGLPDIRAACGRWLTRRFSLSPGAIDPEQHIMPLSGTKEGLFALGMLLGGHGPDHPRPLAGMPNPMYPIYEAATRFGGLEPVYLNPVDQQIGIMDPDALDPALLDRMTVLFLCNPSNPQGGILDRDGLAKMVALARKHGFVLVSDECYAELYYGEPSPSVLEVCDGNFDNVLAYHSLSKRSSAAGLRTGFMAGDPRLIDAMGSMRSFYAAGMPHPIIAATVALWDDDEHVAENRARYAEKYEIAETLLSGKLPVHKPGGGFFLWLDISGTAYPTSEAATMQLWKSQGLRVLPGAYLASAPPGQPNPADSFIRLALIHPNDVITEIMHRLIEGLEL